MDHSLSQNPPLHWSYSTNNNNNNNSSSSSNNNNNNNPTSSWQPIIINNNNNNNNHRGTKRPLSESDCDDAYSEESSKEQCTSPGDTDSCQMLSRKKRRGVIEKKRRDRINMSLSELKRLVPSAFEKQGSAKLEKAEILALTVDHLKTLHAKGLDSLAFEQQKYAVDYHGMGFRECLAEVTRYLDRVEGMDPQNPMRLRLTSHLQCCAAQKELQLKQATSVPPWTPYGSPHQTYSSAATLNPLSSPSNNHHHHHHHHPHHQFPPLPPSSSSSLHHHHHSQQMHHQADLGGHYDISTSCTQNILTPLTPTEANRLAPPPPSSTSTLLTPLTTTTSSALAYSPHHQYPPPSSSSSSSSVMNSFGLPPSSSSSKFTIKKMQYLKKTTIN